MNEKSNNDFLAMLKTSPFSSGGVQIDFSQNKIIYNDNEQQLQPKVIELLVLLCSAKSHTFSKESLTTLLWPNTIVGPDSLANSMARLRKALGDDAKSPKFIQTVPRKGYRWLPLVEVTTTEKKQKPFIKYIVLFLLCLTFASVLVVLNYPKHEQSNPPETFLFPDLAIKKLENGGYEIQAGIEGKLTPEKKAAMLAEIKRITGEEHSGMVFTVDPVEEVCKHNGLKSDKNELSCKTKN